MKPMRYIPYTIPRLHYVEVDDKELLLCQHSEKLKNTFRSLMITPINSMNGYNKDSLKLFDLMKHLRTNLTNITFVCVLLICNHSSLTNEGCSKSNNIDEQ